jgi:hypothetical protein
MYTCLPVPIHSWSSQRRWSHGGRNCSPECIDRGPATAEQSNEPDRDPTVPFRRHADCRTDDCSRHGYNIVGAKVLINLCYSPLKFKSSSRDSYRPFNLALIRCCHFAIWPSVWIEACWFITPLALADGSGAVASALSPTLKGTGPGAFKFYNHTPIALATPATVIAQAAPGRQPRRTTRHRPPSLTTHERASSYRSTTLLLLLPVVVVVPCTSATYCERAAAVCVVCARARSVRLLAPNNGSAGGRSRRREPAGGDAVAVRGRGRQQLRGARARGAAAGGAAVRRRLLRRAVPVPPLEVPPPPRARRPGGGRQLPVVGRSGVAPRPRRRRHPRAARDAVPPARVAAPPRGGRRRRPGGGAVLHLHQRAAGRREGEGAPAVRPLLPPGLRRRLAPVPAQLPALPVPPRRRRRQGRRLSANARRFDRRMTSGPSYQRPSRPAAF